MKGDGRRDGEEFGEMNVSEGDTDVPRMSQHRKRPVISPGDGFRLEFKQQMRWNSITVGKAERGGVGCRLGSI